MKKQTDAFTLLFIIFAFSLAFTFGSWLYRSIGPFAGITIGILFFGGSIPAVRFFVWALTTDR
ncbi:MAG: hypothetical protein M0Z41_13870 [Peptococcaceae bacterium]|nr:hypothetical protein [Peptococcaceae bacterium]